MHNTCARPNIVAEKDEDDKPWGIKLVCVCVSVCVCVCTHVRMGLI